jgi:hypothetical protein
LAYNFPKINFSPVKTTLTSKSGFFGRTVWNRTRIGSWLPPLSKDNPELRRFIEANGWEMYG